MRKLKLLFAALACGAMTANADVMLETDLTSSFNSLATTQWTGSSGQVTWAAPQVTTNSGLTVAAWERYDGNCTYTGTLMKTTVTGLTPGTYKIELYGAAAFTYARRFGSELFTGDTRTDYPENQPVSDTYKDGESINANTGVSLYATTSEGNYSQEIPIWYATNFNTSGLSTAVLNGVVVGSNGQIEIGMSKTSLSTNWHVVQLKGVTATVSGDAAIANLKATANSLLTNATYTNVVGQERIALAAAAAATPAEETEAAYRAVIDALNTAIPNFENCDVAAYNALAAEVTKAYHLGMFTQEQAAQYLANNAANLTGALCPSYVQQVMVQEYNYVTTTYSHAVNIGTWTTVNATERSSQHWDGTATSTYSEQNEGWGSGNWSCSYSQNLTLPAGKYVFKVAGRRSSNDAVLTLTVKNGETVIGTVNDFPIGDTGLGINKSGATSFDANDDVGFAKNPNHTNDDLMGCGWQWRYVAFELADPATVNVAVTASATPKEQWVGFCNATVQTDNADNVALMEALIALNSAKTAATLTELTANIGDGVFQISESENTTKWNAYTTAKSDAEAYTLTASSTVAEVEALTTALTDAQRAYETFASEPTLKEPTTGQKFTISMANGSWEVNGITLNNEAITYIAGARQDMGNYNVGYSAVANPNLAQAFTFTKVSGNNYKLSQLDADGNERYLSTGTAYEGGTAAQIRTTTDADKAMQVTVIPTNEEGIYNLKNVEANALLGAQDQGVFTTGSHNKYSIAEAAQASVSVTIANDVNFATRIFPFTPTLPSGVTAYTLTGVSGDKLTLTEATTPAANVPYVLYAENGCDEALTGWGTAGAETYTTGLLTGVYVETTPAAGTYVLQNSSTNGVGFFKVPDTGFEKKIAANRCYMTAPSTARDAFFFDFGEASGIDAIEALTSGKAQIFNAAGAQVPGLQKGINIIKLENGSTRKIMVK